MENHLLFTLDYWADKGDIPSILKQEAYKDDIK